MNIAVISTRLRREIRTPGIFHSAAVCVPAWAPGEIQSDGKMDNLVDFKPDGSVGFFTFMYLQRKLSQILESLWTL